MALIETGRAHLARINGTSGHCLQGRPESGVTRRCLASAGFAPTEESLREAILSGGCLVDEIVLVSGEEGASAW